MADLAVFDLISDERLPPPSRHAESRQISRLRPAAALAFSVSRNSLRRNELLFLNFEIFRAASRIHRLFGVQCVELDLQLGPAVHLGGLSLDGGRGLDDGGLLFRQGYFGIGEGPFQRPASFRANLRRSAATSFLAASTSFFSVGDFILLGP